MYSKVYFEYDIFFSVITQILWRCEQFHLWTFIEGNAGIIEREAVIGSEVHWPAIRKLTLMSALQATRLEEKAIPEVGWTKHSLVSIGLWQITATATIVNFVRPHHLIAASVGGIWLWNFAPVVTSCSGWHARANDPRVSSYSGLYIARREDQILSHTKFASHDSSPADDNDEEFRSDSVPGLGICPRLRSRPHGIIPVDGSILQRWLVDTYRPPFIQMRITKNTL